MLYKSNVRPTPPSPQSAKEIYSKFMNKNYWASFANFTGIFVKN
jgi:hypothetical protein